MSRRKAALPDGVFRILGIPDTHVPFHDPAALDVLLQYLRARHWDAVCHVGDFLDMQSLSRFVANNLPALVAGVVSDEMSQGHQIWRSIATAARHVNPHCTIDYLEGNHEVRTRRFEAAHPQLRGLLDVGKLLRLDELGVNFIPQDSTGQVLRFEWNARGDVVRRVRSPRDSTIGVGSGVTFVHGLSHAKHSTSNTADMMPWPGIVGFGHVHNRSSYTAKRWGPDKPFAISIGHIADPDQDYIAGRPTSWEQGLGEFVLARGAPGIVDGRVLRISRGVMLGTDDVVYRSAL